MAFSRVTPPRDISDLTSASGKDGACGAWDGEEELATAFAFEEGKEGSVGEAILWGISCSGKNGTT